MRDEKTGLPIRHHMLIQWKKHEIKRSNREWEAVRDGEKNEGSRDSDRANTDETLEPDDITMAMKSMTQEPDEDNISIMCVKTNEGVLEEVNKIKVNF